MKQPPNIALQPTSPASPSPRLSGKMLGDGSLTPRLGRRLLKTWCGLWMVLVAAVLGAQHESAQSTAVVATGDSTRSHHEMKGLVNAFLGTWTITETTVPRPGSVGATHSGKEVWQTATGGLTLIEENQTKLPAGDAHDTAVIWWDGKAQRIRGLWCADINSEGCSGFTVSWEGGQAIMVGEWEDESGRHAWKEQFAFSGPNAFTQTLFVGAPGGGLERVSVIRATRTRDGVKKR